LGKKNQREMPMEVDTFGDDSSARPTNDERKKLKEIEEQELGQPKTRQNQR